MQDDSTQRRDVAQGGRGFLLYSNVPVGAVAAAFVLGTYALLALPLDGPLLVLATCGAFLVYQADRVLHIPPEDAINQPERYVWRQHHRGMTAALTGIAIVGVVAMLPFLRTVTVVLGGALAGLSLLYVAPLLPGRQRLKSIWFIKPVAIAVAWAVGGVLAPVLEAGRPVTLGVITLLGARVLFVLPNALLADWPDREGDRRVGLSTPALRLSAHTVRLLALGSLLGSGLFLAATAALLDAGWLVVIDGGGLLLMLGAVLRPPGTSRWFYGVVIDAIVAWPGITALVWFLGGR